MSPAPSTQHIEVASMQAWKNDLADTPHPGDRRDGVLAASTPRIQITNQLSHAAYLPSQPKHGRRNPSPVVQMGRLRSTEQVGH